MAEPKKQTLNFPKLFSHYANTAYPNTKQFFEAQHIPFTQAIKQATKNWTRLRKESKRQAEVVQSRAIESAGAYIAEEVKPVIAAQQRELLKIKQQAIDLVKREIKRMKKTPGRGLKPSDLKILYEITKTELNEPMRISSKHTTATIDTRKTIFAHILTQEDIEKARRATLPPGPADATRAHP